MAVLPSGVGLLVCCRRPVYWSVGEVGSDMEVVPVLAVPTAVCWSALNGDPRSTESIRLVSSVSLDNRLPNRSNIIYLHLKKYMTLNVIVSS